MLKGQDIVCLSLTPWETTLPSTAHFLMREFAKENRVLFVDHPLTLKDGWTQRLSPRWKRTLGLWPRLREAGRMHVLTPPFITPSALSTSLFDFAMDLSARQVAGVVREAMAELGMRRPILWIAFDVPLGLHLCGRLDESLILYHCYDEIGGEPYIARHGTRLEPLLMRRADLVITTSRTLYEARRTQHPACHWVPNGVDFERFATAQEPQLSLHPALAGIPHPILGYLGNLETRVDFELLAQVAKARPDWSLVLMGPVQEAYRSQVRALSQLPNVFYLGACPPHEAPRFLKGIDVGLIPFVHSRQTHAIYPLKLNEYLAAGLPVVMTSFAPLEEFAEVCWSADGSTAFLEAVEEALEKRDVTEVMRRQGIADRHDWSERAETLGRLLMAVRAEGARKEGGMS